MSQRHTVDLSHFAAACVKFIVTAADRTPRRYVTRYLHYSEAEFRSMPPLCVSGATPPPPPHTHVTSGPAEVPERGGGEGDVIRAAMTHHQSFSHPMPCHEMSKYDTEAPDLTAVNTAR